MHCEIKNRPQVVDDYLSGRLSAAEREAFDEHCFDCDLCFQELRFQEMCAGLIKKEGRQLFADYLQMATQPQAVPWLERLRVSLAGIGYRRLAWAVVTVVVIALAGNVLYHSYAIKQEKRATVVTGDSLQNVLTQSSEETIQQQVEAQQFDDKAKGTPAKSVGVDKARGRADEEAFAAFAYLEESVDDFTRSSGLQVISPEVDDTLTVPIVFRWQNKDASVRYLKILNNKGMVVAQGQPTANQWLFTQPLSPGRYYWKLESEDEVVYWGRFFIPLRP